jgi:hypothetical protein
MQGYADLQTYTRPGGVEPYCYVADVPKEKIETFRAAAH